MIYLTGDTHGGYDVKKLLDFEFKKEDYLIILGDFGFIWETLPENLSSESTRLDFFLKMVGCTVLFVDGN